MNSKMNQPHRLPRLHKIKHLLSLIADHFNLCNIRHGPRGSCCCRISGQYQFIDFSCNLPTEAHEIHGSTTESCHKSLELETVAAILKYLAANLFSSTPNQGPIIGHQLRSLTDELLNTIEYVKLKGSNSSFRSFERVLQHVGKNKKIGSSPGSLPECKDSSTRICSL